MQANYSLNSACIYVIYFISYQQRSEYESEQFLLFCAHQLTQIRDLHSLFRPQILRWVPTKKYKSRDFPESLVK